MKQIDDLYGFESYLHIHPDVGKEDESVLEGTIKGIKRRDWLSNSRITNYSNVENYNQRIYITYILIFLISIFTFKMYSNHKQ